MQMEVKKQAINIQNQRVKGPPHRFTKGNKFGNRFKPGICPNPNGRAGSLRDLFNHVFNSPDKKNEIPAEKALKKLSGFAKRGNLRAIKLWLEYGLSKPPQEINLGGQANNPLNHNFRFVIVDEKKSGSKNA
jgi:hypothetical protein